VDTVTKALLRLMKRAGCYHLKFGVETASTKILHSVHKNQTHKQVINAINFTKQAGIEAHACFIINFPDETMQSIKNTIKYAIFLKPTFVVFSLLKPFPGSEIYLNAKKQGQLIHERWDMYGKEDPPVLKNQLSNEELGNILRKAYNAFYIRPQYILMRILELLNAPSFRNLQKLMQGFLAFLPSGEKH
jgi:radical SAM superfamily enzyme YgiQ (UPF0313 family)